MLDSSGKGSSTIANGSDDWWVVYPRDAGEGVSVSLVNNGPSSSRTINADLDGTDGRDQVVQLLQVIPGTSGDLSGKAADSDRYYIELRPDGCLGPAP